MRQLAQGQKTSEGRGIKANSLVRSSYIEPTPEHREYLEDLGIITVFDFRSGFEINAKPNFATINVNFYPLGRVVNEELQKANAIKFQVPDMVEFYRGGFENCLYLKSAVRDIVLNPRSVLYHCSAGKDRTGVFSIILMSMLGFSKADINSHYLEIDPLFIKHSREQIKGLMPDVKDEDIEDLITVKQEYFDAYYDAVIDKYGSFDDYISLAFNLEPEQIEKFKDYYLI